MSTNFNLQNSCQGEFWRIKLPWCPFVNAAAWDVVGTRCHLVIMDGFYVLLKIPWRQIYMSSWSSSRKNCPSTVIHSQSQAGMCTAFCVYTSLTNPFQSRKAKGEISKMKIVFEVWFCILPLDDSAIYRTYLCALEQQRGATLSFERKENLPHDSKGYAAFTVLFREHHLSDASTCVLIILVYFSFVSHYCPLFCCLFVPCLSTLLELESYILHPNLHYMYVHENLLHATY